MATKNKKRRSARFIVGAFCAAVSLCVTNSDRTAAPAEEALVASDVDDRAARGQLQAVVMRHCKQCHGDKQTKANLRLDEFGSQHWNDYGLLDELLTRIGDGDMPPDDAEVALADDERRRVVKILENRLDAIAGSRLGGTLNRLTRREWCDTLFDLTGIEVEKPYELPIDSSHPMTRLGEHQLLTPMAMRQYQQVASRYVDEVILDTLPEVETYTVDLTKAENQIGNSKNEAQPWGILSHNDRTILAILSPVKTVALEGVYEFKFDYYFTLGADVKTLKKGETPKPISVDENRHFGRFHSGGEILNKGRTRNLNGEKFHPSGKVMYYRFDEPLRVRLSKESKTTQFTIEGNGSGPRWVVTRVTVRGPMGKTYPSSHERIFGNAPRDGDLAQCKAVLDTLAVRLFRRPVTSEMMSPYYAISRAEYDRGGNLYSATKACMKAMLCSPYFIFKETGDKPELEGRMIATRLSYFLNNSMPDERLMSLAAEGKLIDPAVRRAEAERLLGDSHKTGRFVHLFVHQWLGLAKFADFAPNVAYIKTEHHAQLRPSVEEEPYAFFTELLQHNLSARNLIDSGFVVWDKALADYYGGKNIGVSNKDLEGRDFQRLSLTKTPEASRARLGGLVTMPIIMSMTTDGETTQPFLRGAWVIKHLLGKELEPLDSIPALEIDLSNVDKPKEILRLHKKDPSCASCHVKMDYMGLALENFDVMGRWQSNYLIPVIGEKNRFEIVTKDPVDAAAESPDGKPVDGAAGLKQHLFEREDEILRNLIEKLFAYAIGRKVRYQDRQTIDRMMKTAKANDYKLRDIIIEIVAADRFIRR